MRQYLVSTEKAPNPGQKLFKARVINATVPIEKPLEEKAQPLKTNSTAKVGQPAHEHVTARGGTAMYKGAGGALHEGFSAHLLLPWERTASYLLACMNATHQQVSLSTGSLVVRTILATQHEPKAHTQRLLSTPSRRLTLTKQKEAVLMSATTRAVSGSPHQVSTLSCRTVPPLRGKGETEALGKEQLATTVAQACSQPLPAC